jgi:hypothetical protein
MLRPHFEAGLTAYAQKDRKIILSAYGAGCLLLCDLLSQNKCLPDWREAGFMAFRLLTSTAAIGEPPSECALAAAFHAAEDVTQLARERGDCREICRMLDAAIEEMSAERTAGRGAVALRAAMVRLEALARSVQAMGLHDEIGLAA